LIEKDEAIHGRSPNAKTFVLISDGQAWSGAVARSLRLAAARGIPVSVVGVGTTTGGYIPAMPPADPGAPTVVSAIPAALARASLGAMAAGGGGEYFELDRDSDREIATRIIDAPRRRAGSRGVEEIADDLYWPCLAAAAGLVAVGLLALRDRAELWLQLATTA